MPKKNTVLKSNNDDLDYKIIKLDNQLEAIVISDLETEMSVASVLIKCGSFEDPLTEEGLAHFLEHSIFFGSEKYPKNDDYSNFISENGGSTNAYTADGHTVYYHEIKNEAFEKSLDILASLFSCPTFPGDFVEKEISAIQNEFTQTLNNSYCREEMILKLLSNDKNVFRMLHFGNRSTLFKPDIISKVKNFYENSYSSNIMKVVLYSNKKVDVIEKYLKNAFSCVKNKNLPGFEYKNCLHPFDSTSLGKMVKIKGLVDEHKLHLGWSFESHLHEYRSNPFKIITHLLEHACEGSLKNHLKDLDLIDSLNCYQNDHADLFTYFTIQIQLTDLGLSNIDKVIQMIGAKIDFLKKSKSPNYVFEELCALNEIDFEYQDKEEPLDKVLEVIENLVYYPAQECNVIRYLLEEDNHEKRLKIYSKMILENCIVVLTSSKFEGLESFEPIYSIQYQIFDLEKDLCKKFNFPDFDVQTIFKYPSKNPLMPKDLKMIPIDESIDENVILPNVIHKHKNGSIIYFKTNTSFGVPKISVRFRCLLNYQPGMLKINSLYSFIWKKFFQDNCRNILFFCDFSDIEFSFQPCEKYVQINIYGYKDIVFKFLENLADEMKKIHKNINSQESKIEMTNKFLKYKTILRQKIDKMQKKEPNQLALNYFESCIFCPVESKPKKEKLLEIMNFDDFSHFSNNFMQSYHSIAMVVGNSLENEAKLADEQLHKLFSTIPKNNLSKNETIPIIPQKFSSSFKIILQKKSRNTAEMNSAILVSQQVPFTLENQLILQLLNIFIENDFFEKFRTNEQLGYLVQTQYKTSINMCYFLFIIQSETFLPVRIGEKITLYKKQFFEKLKKFEKVFFENAIDSLISLYNQPFVTIEEEINYYFGEVVNEVPKLKSVETKIKEIKKLNMEKVCQFFEKYFILEEKVLEIHVCCQTHFSDNSGEVQKIVNDKIKTVETVKDFHICVKQ